MVLRLLLFSCLCLAATMVVAAPDETSWQVEFTVNLGRKNTGKFVLEVHPEWAPLGAERFRELVDQKFFTGVRFFRVISGFMAQFGIHGTPSVAAEWREKTLKDDPVVESNARGFVSFATSGKDSRTTQMFINFADNSNLDGMGFSPFAKVVSGMDVVDAIYSGYGEGAPSGKGPEQGKLQAAGNKYLKKEFPRLSYITGVKVMEAGEL